VTRAPDGGIRLLTERDIAAALELSTEAGWNQTADDWRMLLRLEPQGCFCIDADGRVASTATLICYGRRLAWIGMVLTGVAYRRRGFARRLLRHVIERADRLGVQSLKLDATNQGQPLYQSLGFRAEQAVERWSRAAVYKAAGEGEGQGKLQGSPAVLWFGGDLEAYGADRSRLLRLLGERSRRYSAAGGFCLWRPGLRARYVGPCIASDAESACGLIERCAAEESYWDLLVENRAAVEIATRLGFTRQRSLIRMVRGSDLRGRPEWIYGVAGFELG
jgi:GNAT superfamily N-acetyltransferase